MAIVTISRGAHSRGKEVAEKVAVKLGYACLSREILLEASAHYNVPEIKLMKAINDAPSMLDHLTFGKERYVAFIRASLLRTLCQDNIVYHGQAGHFFLEGLSHVLKVRIIADINERVRVEMERDSRSREDALSYLQKEDDRRRKWSSYFYGIDTWDSSLYDLVIHIKKLDADDAVNIICDTVKLKRFQTTPESQKELEKMALMAQLNAKLT